MGSNGELNADTKCQLLNEKALRFFQFNQVGY